MIFSFHHTDHPTNRAAKTASLLVLALFFLFTLSTVTPAAKIKFKARVPRIRYLVGEKMQIEYKNTARITYKFKSSNKKVFKVTKTGLIAAKGKGHATLTITGTWRKGSKSKTWTKQLTIYVCKCKLSKEELSLNQGGGKTLKVKGLTIDGKSLKRKITWESESPAVCSVSQGGTVTGLTEGTGIVRAHVGDSVVLRCRVTVSAKDLGRMSFHLLVNPTHTYGALDLAAELYKEAGAGQPVSYSIGNPALGHMSGNIYYADQYGSNTVAAYWGGCKKTITLTQSSWAAHRGYSDMHPENTTDAFVGAVYAGAAYIETDVRVTKDGELICFHSGHMSAMTDIESVYPGVDDRVTQLTFEQIRNLKIDNGNCVETLKDPHIPTLEEYLKICSQYHIISIIEIKHLGWIAQKEESARKIMQLLQKYGMQNRTIVLSFNDLEQYNILQVFQQTVGASIPIAHCNGDQASYNALIAQGLTNVYIHHSATPLGYEVMEDYSPLVGRMHRSSNGSSSYHYDMWLPSLTALNPAIAYPYE